MTDGNQVPYSEPNYMQGWRSSYYTESHKKFQLAVREWVDENVEGQTFQWDEQKSVPKDIWKKCSDAGILPVVAGVGWNEKWVGHSNVAGGISPKELDYFHEQIAVDEICLAGSGGVCTVM